MQSDAGVLLVIICGAYGIAGAVYLLAFLAGCFGGGRKRKR
jgi:hypothetical protein